MERERRQKPRFKEEKSNWRQKLKQNIVNTALAGALLAEPTSTRYEPPRMQTYAMPTGMQLSGETQRLKIVSQNIKDQGPQTNTQQSKRRITPFTFATNPTREQTAASEQIEVQIKEAIEQNTTLLLRVIGGKNSSVS